jgi:RNA polymerase sigma factor (TIGR02999 family)
MSGGEMTMLLARWSTGDRKALDEIFPYVYDDLRRLAAGQLRHERKDHTLQTTALVHESYLRLIGREGASIETRSQFFAVAAQVLRRVLVDHARKRRRQKRGGDAITWVIDESLDAAAGRGLDLVRLDDALTDLSNMDRRQAEIVEMKFFGGLEMDEIANIVGVSTSTVKRDWASARAWLLRELE